jgi:hypothetical protein
MARSRCKVGMATGGRGGLIRKIRNSEKRTTDCLCTMFNVGSVSIESKRDRRFGNWCTKVSYLTERSRFDRAADVPRFIWPNSAP